ncbi:MAG: sterol desaturase family protein [Myxococcales bacterium]|nr:sterol desaturase family protein [Myxococcales bacterium]MCB9642928.1 sterol desaturase family protein [Myxococcales bacterium]
MPRKVAPDDPTRIYQNDILERMTRSHPYEPLVVYIPVVLGLIVYMFLKSPFVWYNSIALVATGLFYWSFMEYILHRYLFHYEAKSKIGKHIMRLIHGIHHQFPNDTDRLVIPLGASFLSALIFVAIYYGLTGGNAWAILPLVIGTIVGYVNYDWTHYATHHVKPRFPWEKTQRRRHMLHHFKFPDACFGVSTGLWDWVFRTREQDAEKAVAAGKMRAYPSENWKILDNKANPSEPI